MSSSKYRTQSDKVLPSGEGRGSNPTLVDEDGVPRDAGAAHAKVEELARGITDDTLVGGKTFNQLSLYEKKSVLINAELEYQWCIFFLCGFGYFLDLCWAQAFGLVSSAIVQELGVPISNLSAAFNTGLTVGAFSWGLLVDILGRRFCFNFTCIIASVFGFCFAGPSNYGALCFFASLIGFGVGGNIPIDATITIEFLPKNRRFLLAALSTFQPIGVVVACLISYGLIPRYSCGATLPSCKTGTTPCCTKSSNMGWRYVMIVLGSITLTIFILRFVIFKFRESPKFLLAKGRDLQALDVLHSIALFNTFDPPKLSIEDFRVLDYEEAQKNSVDSRTAMIPSSAGEGRGEGGNHAAPKVVVKGAFERTFGHLRGIVGTRMYAWLFVMLAIAYMALFWSFSIAGYFLPLILRAKGVNTAGQSLQETYRQYIWIYLPGITATLAASCLMEVPRLGRKWPMVIAALLMGASDILYQTANSIAANVGLNAMEYWFQSLFAALLYAYTPEAFPAPVRGSASGMLSTLGRIASIVAPLAAGTLYNGGDSPGVLYLAAGAAFLSAIAIALLPFDTRGKQSF